VLLSVADLGLLLGGGRGGGGEGATRMSRGALGNPIDKFSIFTDFCPGVPHFRKRGGTVGGVPPLTSIHVAQSATGCCLLTISHTSLSLSLIPYDGQ